MWPAIIGGIATLAQGIGNWFTSKRNTDKTNEANLELAKYQYSKDLEMWQKVNEYNSPQMQMQRLREAGLNPNMVYGSGTVTGNTTGQLPKFQAPRMEYNYQNPLQNLPNAIGAYQDIQIKQQQLDNLKAQQQQIETNTAIKKFEADNASLFYNARTRERMAKSWIAEGERSWRNTSWNEHESNYERLMNAKLNLAEGSLGYQLSYLAGRNKAQNTSIEKMIESMEAIKASKEYTKLKTDWYVTQVIGKLGMDAANTLLKIPGAFRPGKSFNQNKRVIEDASNWRKLQQNLGRRGY